MCWLEPVRRDGRRRRLRPPEPAIGAEVSRPHSARLAAPATRLATGTSGSSASGSITLVPRFPLAATPTTMILSTYYNIYADYRGRVAESEMRRACLVGGSFGDSEYVLLPRTAPSPPRPARFASLGTSSPIPRRSGQNALGMANLSQYLRTVEVQREESEPVRCKSCQRRNYSMGEDDERSEIIWVGTGELRRLYLCHEH